MSYSFDPTEKIIVVRAELRGPASISVVWLVLDTGSSRTMIRADILASLGYDLSAATQFAQLTTASGAINVSLITVSSIAALGRNLSDIPVVAHRFPQGFPYAGLLGLDFFRDSILTIDFNKSEISLS